MIYRDLSLVPVELVICGDAKNIGFELCQKKKNARRIIKMNKGDLINEVAQVVNTKKDAQAAVECVLSTIIETLKKEESVTLVGFGTFKVVKRDARKGRNPQTGAEMQIEAKKVPKFVPGKSFKEAVK